MAEGLRGITAHEGVPTEPIVDEATREELQQAWGTPQFHALADQVLRMPEGISGPAEAG